MFTGVTWRGDEGNAALYYKNTQNAFQTAPFLAASVSLLPGEKYIAGHSLGNMVVSSAIADYHLSVTKYFMINAAVATEAYDELVITDETIDNMMCPGVSPTTGFPSWVIYRNLMHLWASQWYDFFPNEDGRHGLTWRNRFNSISNAINYYSSGEDVLKNGDGKLHVPAQEGIWACQEMLKGTDWLEYLDDIFPQLPNSQGGWGYNSYYFQKELVDQELKDRLMTPEEAAYLTPDNLREHTFFRPFDNKEICGPNGSVEAAKHVVRAKILSEAVSDLYDNSKSEI
jgi:hypothetical protein